MTAPSRHGPGEAAADVAIDTARKDSGGRLTAVVSAVALLFSGYSLWESSFKSANLEAFVPPVIQYSSPYQGSNFEVFAVPITIVNDGGRTGTVLSMELQATNSETNETKRFYSADFGRWTMEKTRSGAYAPFAPISLAGKESRTETVLFYPVTPEEKPEQLVTKPGRFSFKLILDEAAPSVLGAGGGKDRTHTDVRFDMELRFFDARAFQNGTLPLYSISGRSAKSGESAP